MAAKKFRSAALVVVSLCAHRQPAMCTRLLAIILGMCVTTAWADEKLLVRFQSAERCRVFVQQNAGAAGHLWNSRVWKASGHVLASTSTAAEALALFEQTAAIWTPNPDSLIRILRFDTTVAAVWKPYRYQLDRSAQRPAEIVQQWYLDALGATGAWQYSRGDGAVVGVIDTGIDWMHPDLQSSLWINPAEDRNGNGRFDPWPSAEVRDGVPGDLDGIDNDGNGFADDVIGYNFIARPQAELFPMDNPLPYDRNGHGTAVAALIAARPATSAGMSGLAPGATVMVLQAFDPLGFGDEDDIARAIVYAVANGAHVINCSFGDIVRSELVAAAIALAQASDVVVVASSGNSGSQLPHYPGDEVGVLSIGASTRQGKAAIFSSYGERLFLLAPGEQVLSAAAGGGYQEGSGTSFAAPLVSATVALLRSLDPQLDSKSIRAILATTATPQSQSWQLRSGHGIVSPRDALERAALRGSIELRAPRHPASLSAQLGSLDVELDALHPLLERWELFAIGRDTAVMLATSERSTLAWSERIEAARIPRDSLVTLRLRVVLRTGKTIEDAARVERVSSRLQFEMLGAFSVWFGRERRLLLRAQVNRPCQIAASVQNNAGDTILVSTGDGQVRRLHAVLLDRLMPGRYQLRVTAWDGADSVSATLDSVVLPAQAGSNAEWRLARYTAEPLLLAGSASPSAGTLCATRFRGVQEAALLERNQDTFRIIARSGRTAFLRGIGDVNGDGRAEVLTYDAGDTRLYEFEPTPFASVLWGDTLRHSFWAAALADITGDQRPEILGFRTQRIQRNPDGTEQPRSDALIAVTWNGAQFVELDSIELSSPPQAGRTLNTISAPLCAVGDFDGNGAIEIAYADSDGDLEIAAWKSGRFVREFGAPSPPFLAGAGTEFVAAADVDGDGRAEILTGAAALPTYNALGEYEPPLWRFALYRATAPNRYELVWEEYFYGVRYGRPYYDGVATGDLDGDGKAEIVLSLFPFAYVFSWGRGTPELIGIQDSVWSNGALIADLERDGTVELALTRGIQQPRTQWFVYEPSPLRAPAILDAYFRSDGALVCMWLPRDRAEHYEIRVAGSVVARTSDTLSILPIAVLPPCVQCSVQVRAVTELDSSRWSDPFVVVRSEPLKLIAADTLSAGDRILRLTVGGVLPPHGIAPFSLRIERDSLTLRAEYTAAAGAQRLLAWLGRSLDEGLYRVSLAAGTVDGVGNRSPASSVYLYVRPQVERSSQFYAERVVAWSDTAVSVRFSQEPDLSTLALDSIVIEPYGAIVGYLKRGDAQAVEFILDRRFRYEARGMMFTMTLPRSFRSTAGNMIAGNGGNVVAWYYAADVPQTQAFPQPWSRSRDRELHFSNVPPGATVIISLLDGIELAQIEAVDPAGGVRWLPRLPDGRLLPEGIYLYRIRLPDGTEPVVQKFVVVP